MTLIPSLCNKPSQYSNKLINAYLTCVTLPTNFSALGTFVGRLIFLLWRAKIFIEIFLGTYIFSPFLIIILLGKEKCEIVPSRKELLPFKFVGSNTFKKIYPECCGSCHYWGTLVEEREKEYTWINPHNSMQ